MRSDAKSDMKEAHAHFQETRTVDGNTCPLANNLSGEDEVLENLLVDAGKGAAAGTLLHDAGGTGGLAQHPALGNEDDMAVRELLLELPGQPSTNNVNPSSLDAFGWIGSAPLLDLVESLELGNRDEDDDGLLATTNVDLPGSGDLERAELSLELGDVVFEVNQGLRDRGFGLIGGGGGGVRRAEDLVLDGHVGLEALGTSGQHPPAPERIQPISPAFSLVQPHSPLLALRTIHQQHPGIENPTHRACRRRF